MQMHDKEQEIIYTVQTLFRGSRSSSRIPLAELNLTIIRWLPEIDSQQCNSYCLHLQIFASLAALAIYFHCPCKSATKFTGNIYK